MINTEHQIYPICPWCDAELDPEEVSLDTEESSMEDRHLSMEVVCPECNEPLEITTTLVYTTYKSDKESDDMMCDETYEEEIDCIEG